ncbi:hypothetical protein LguiA_027106 [Lonicera macranthoides]
MFAPSLMQSECWLYLTTLLGIARFLLRGCYAKKLEGVIENSVDPSRKKKRTKALWTRNSSNGQRIQIALVMVSISKQGMPLGLSIHTEYR